MTTAARDLPVLVTVMISTLISCASPTSPPADTASRAVPVPPAPHTNSAPFVSRLDDAFGSPPPRLRVLVPVGNCVLGIADERDRTGYHVSNWVGEQGCTRLVRAPGGVLAVTSAVPTDDGSVIGVGESLLRRDPDGSVHQLAALPPQHRVNDLGAPVPLALARSGQRLIVVGRQLVYDHDWKYFPTAWESTDGGVTVHAIQLPLLPAFDLPKLADPQGLAAPVAPMTIAVDGATVLVTDWYPYGGVQVGRRMWRSVDGGSTWSVFTIPVNPPGSGEYDIVGLLKVGERWLLILQKLYSVDPSAHLVLGSADGAQWTVETRLDLGRGSLVAATRDSDGNLVLIGSDELPPPVQGLKLLPTSCEVVWTGSIGNIVRRNLGCPVPRLPARWRSTFDMPTAVATLADGRVLITDSAGNIWLRPV